MQQHRLFVLALTLAALLGAAVMTSQVASAHQYVINGGFEDGTEAWSLLSEGSSFDTGVDDVPSHDGEHRGRILLGQANFRLNQSVSNVPPGTYEISLSVRVESTTAVVKLDLLTDPAWAERFSAVTFNASPGEWQHVTAEVVIPGSSWVSIRLSGSGTVGDRIYIDDVLFEGPPPATMTPTRTHTPVPPTDTPVPPTPTRTPKVAATPSPPASATSLANGMPAFGMESLLNGGFEDAADGLPVAWDKYGGSLSVTTAPVRSGGYAARLQSSTDSTKWLFQTVNVTSNTSYSFDAWIWHDDPNVASAFLRISWYASNDGSGEAIGTADSLTRLERPSTEWRYLSTAGVTAPDQAHSAKLRIVLQPLSSSSAIILVDDATFGLATRNSHTPAPGAAMNSTTEGSNARPIGGVSRSTIRSDVNASSQRAGIGENIVVNEVLYDSVDGTDAHGEWIELYNAGLESVDLEGWILADGMSVDVLPPYILAANAFVVIVASDRLLADMDAAGVPSLQIQGNIGNSLNNSGDVVALIEPSGRIVDAVSWGDDTSAFDVPVADVPAGHSIERVRPGFDTDSEDNFIDNERPSPGRPYAQSVSPAPLVPQQTSKSVTLIPGESAESISWLVWALVAGSMGVLAAVASTRLAPVIANRLRDQ